MHDAVFVAQYRGGRRGGFCLGEYRVDMALRVRIKHEKLASVRARVAKEFQAIGFRPGERLLVAKNNAGGIILELSGAYEAAARPALIAAGDGVFLCVCVKRIGGVL